MRRVRDVAAAKRRGRWAADSSLRRYGKETRILAELHKVPKEVVVYGELVESQLREVLLGRTPSPLPPTLCQPELEVERNVRRKPSHQ
jgi:hypothetical protein